MVRNSFLCCPGGGVEGESAQVAASARHHAERIRSGDYKPGERIPSLVALNEEFGIANATGQKVMRALRADGLIRGLAARRAG
ncbi:GntR family transcriptional regulator [Nonomuraea sp. NPDC048916]|uniref:GntR family transcriptional regulator n=1 Tax=Nonomuraea sp. NPDC048916 TaxID=3154232 RepID=UPI0033F0DF82